MCRNPKYSVLTIAVLALTMSGMAMAGSISQIDAGDGALYGQPNPFAAVETNENNGRQFSAHDQSLYKLLQRASATRATRFESWRVAPSLERIQDNDQSYSPE